MIDLKTHILKDGNVIYRDTGVLELLYNGLPLAGITVETSRDSELFNQFSDEVLNSDPEPIDLEAAKARWLMPEEFKAIELDELFYSMATNDVERARVDLELRQFRLRDLESLLKYLIYFKHQIDQNQIVIGVGRGSSVASFLLYLIGIHRINPIKHDIDIKEFFKELL